jgi:hypothetical protein
MWSFKKNIFRTENVVLENYFTLNYDDTCLLACTAPSTCNFTSPIILTYSIIQGDACSASNATTYFTFDNANYATTDKLYTNNDCTGIAPNGYYANGTIVRYWNGTNLATPVGC